MKRAVFYRYFLTAFSVILFAVFFNSAVMAEDSTEEAAVDKNKKEILKDIDLFQQSLNKTRSCVSEAKSAADIEKCSLGETTIRFQAIQDILNEIGMRPEERRLYELRPEK